MSNMDAILQGIYLVADIDAHEARERAVHRVIMGDNVESKPLMWNDKFRDWSSAAYGNLIVNAYRMQAEGAYRWTVNRENNVSKFAKDCLLVGRCDSFYEAQQAAERAIAVLTEGDK